MGTHPIFESDFDCLTEWLFRRWFLNCPLKVCEERIMERSKTSGRSDDNLESLRKRFATYEEQTKPVIEQFRSQSKLHEVDSTVPAEDVAAAVSKIIEADSLLVKK